MEETYIFESLFTIRRVLNLPIYKLWNPPICEEKFVNLIGDIFLHLLKNSKNDANLQIDIFNIFGNLIKHYNYSIHFRKRIIEEIKMKDNAYLCNIIPGGVKILVNEFCCNSLLKTLVKDLVENQTDVTNQNTFEKKHCSNILINMSLLMPGIMVEEIKDLTKYLNQDCSNFRLGEN